MPIIQSVEVTAVSVPLDHVTSFSTRTVSERHYCLVKVRSKDGHEGIGFCYVGSAAGELVKLAVEQLFAPKLIGQDSHRTEGIWQEMYTESILQGRSGSVMRAISILDIALWDLNAHSVNLPLHRYLGSFVNDRVPAYASGGYYLDGKTPAKLGKEMEGYVKLGFKAVKMKTGRLSPKEEEARLKAVRSAVGPDIIVTMDANNAWRDIPTAMEYMKRFEQYNPYWMEEPFSPDAIDLHARLAKLTSITIATGEIEVGRWRHRDLVEQGGAEILQTDAAVCGGISEWRKIAAYADVKGITLSPHWFHDLHAPLVAATPNARFVEFFVDDQVLNFRRLINKQLKFKDGDLILHTTPGLGFGFDEKAVKKYAIGKNTWTTIK
ncbi:mandelate racemase/muconate lactonizing enzyme family protein [Polynucleobacter sp. AM-26B4]|jgi:L-alanine-DL-glutamate epimerase-like enolase superfamily enzyme|uniref:mandelate racemase/muconate lactonizing enzyme family protein n=1 Tax=Polynucleobacter sp. AM-26B4 TaxID=2689103 RepID=UPI001C0AF192|nr:mandelate racemase/muconate lactonizing enzyme family protein [Polynucleobacter sp. AM-26B4]MBU3586129.1 mandelate racemase/muconate lactonizing enzyme family protein [Polynucleobacter sp. AM-26B4]